MEILVRVARDGAYTNIALRQSLDKKGLEQRSNAFITELVNGTVRNQLYIDHIIGSFCSVKKIKGYVLVVLRAAVYQIGWMDRVPPSAAVNEAVRMVKSGIYRSLAGFVNGVLRNIVRAKIPKDQADSGIPYPYGPMPAFGSVAYPDPTNEPDKYIGILYSFPIWLVKSLIGWLGYECALQFCRQSHDTPSVSVCVNTQKTTISELQGIFRNEDIQYEQGNIDSEIMHLGHFHGLASMQPYRLGYFHVMDEGAMLAVRVLDPKPGQTIVDLCAAPGGKTFACAYLMNDTGKVYSFDKHPHKLRLMRDSLDRLNLSCVRPILHDATVPDSNLRYKADAVLLDAPCSGFGTLKKKPEIKYNRTQENIKEMVAIQRELLKAASVYVKRGGVLVYCTCTVAREENFDNIRWFTDNYPFSAVNRYTLPDGQNGFIEDNMLQLLPGRNNDGFFIACLISDSGGRDG